MREGGGIPLSFFLEKEGDRGRERKRLREYAREKETGRDSKRN